MKLSIYLLLILLASSIIYRSVDGANILFFFMFSSYSHRAGVWPLVEKLMENGHNVTFFNGGPPKNPHPNVTDVYVNSENAELPHDALNFIQLRTSKGLNALEKTWTKLFDYGIKACSAALSDPLIRKWMSSSSYDLVIINALFNDCAYGFIHNFKAPYVLYGSTAPFGWWTESYGYPDENYPQMQHHFPEEMTFLQRLWNFLQPLYWHFYRVNYNFPQIESLFRKKLGFSDMPPLAEMDSNLSLILVNTHFAEEFPRSLPPSVISVGGMHCTDKRKPIPQDLQTFIEEGKNGFIYFSLGTITFPDSIPQKHKDIIFTAMKNFPRIQFIVKWNKQVQNVSENIKIVQWAPQQDLLAHKQIKAYISHGGLYGTQEAVYHGVPMIVLPIFSDQDFNAERTHSRGRGIRLELFDLTQDELEQAIREITTNISFKQNVQQVSKLFRDRQNSPADTAAWWLEYVLRHNDTSHLRPHGIRKTWYERRCLDVCAFIMLLLLALSFCTYKIFKVILSGLVYLTRPISSKAKEE